MDEAAVKRNKKKYTAIVCNQNLFPIVFEAFGHIN